MKVTTRTLRGARLASGGFVLLLLAIVGVCLWLAKTYHLRLDWTHTGRNSVSVATERALETLKQPVRITAFASENRELRKPITDLVARYQQRKPDIQLEFVNPDSDPARTRAAGVRFDGELLIEVGNAREPLSQLSEEQLTNALLRIARTGERWIVFLAGHGERDPEGRANHDYGTFGEAMSKRGLKARRVTLAENTQIPANTATLVIAGARTDYAPGEVAAIRKYVAGGGNLLWLQDPDGSHGLTALADDLGIQFARGTITDPLSRLVTGAENGNFMVATQYGSQAAVRGFELTTLFPEAGAIRYEAPPGWTTEPIVETTPQSWLETTPGGNAHFDTGRDRRGPLTVALAMTRPVEKREQRVIVVADGDFLANQFIANGGNLDLGMNFVNWTSGDEEFINIPATTSPDQQLNLSRTGQMWIGIGFLFALPLLFLASGTLVWWQRRRA